MHLGFVKVPNASREGKPSDFQQHNMMVMDASIQQM
jgi:hypothetical protein